jgi:hypothetical protein
LGTTSKLFFEHGWELYFRTVMKTHLAYLYGHTFSGSAVIKVFLKMSDFYEIICSKCLKFKKITREEKN